MQRFTSVVAFSALGLAVVSTLPSTLGFAAAATNDLHSRVTSSDGWVAYRVPMISGVDRPCCYVVRDDAAAQEGCNLEQSNWSFANKHYDSPGGVEAGRTLAVYLRVEHGHIERVRAVGASCPVRTASTIRWIESVNPADSVSMLSSLLDHEKDDEDSHDLAALAFHADASATSALAARAKPSHSFKEREQALFWLGQARGSEGADVIERYATTDADPKLRAKAIFALSQSKVPDAYAHILSMARNDPAEDVRGEALFWLVQMDDVHAKNDIITSLKTEASDEVRGKAVFALSQLHDDTADEALIAVLRGDYPRDVKKQALFWLGQSGSPRAMAYFDEALK